MIDPETFLLHTPDAEKTVVYVHTPDGDIEQYPALLVAQTHRRKLFITLEARRRYLTHTLVEDGPPDEVEQEFLDDYAEVEDLMEDAGLDGIHDGEQGIVYHNLLYLLMNP
jgi:hypothetical protein